MRRNACRINLSRADDKLGVFDGADRIRNQVRSRSPNLDALALDFFHLAQRVHECRRALLGEGEAGLSWAGELLHAPSTRATTGSGSGCAARERHVPAAGPSGRPWMG